jgi:hypothetical protein
VYRYGFNAQLAAGALDTQGDLAPVGNNYFIEHGSIAGSVAGGIIR